MRLSESRSSSFPRLLATSSELNFRRALLPRFPYASVFVQLPSEIRIVAVAHLKRRPGIGLTGSVAEQSGFVGDPEATPSRWVATVWIHLTAAG
jgi:hypothetical protein